MDTSSTSSRRYSEVHYIIVFIIHSRTLPARDQNASSEGVCKHSSEAIRPRQEGGHPSSLTHEACAQARVRQGTLVDVKIWKYINTYNTYRELRRYRARAVNPRTSSRPSFPRRWVGHRMHVDAAITRGTKKQTTNHKHTHTRIQTYIHFSSFL